MTSRHVSNQISVIMIVSYHVSHHVSQHVRQHISQHVRQLIPNNDFNNGNKYHILKDCVEFMHLSFGNI